jgi:hypothetical protein
LLFIVLVPAAEQAAGMVKMQVAENDRIDIGMAQTGLLQRLQQSMLVFLDAIAILEFGVKENADAGFQQNITALIILHQQAATGQRDAVLGRGFSPA